MPDKPSRLPGFFVATVVLVFVLIVWGGIVRLSGSGLSIPQWPLAEGGRFIPPQQTRVMIEHLPGSRDCAVPRHPFPGGVGLHPAALPRRPGRSDGDRARGAGDPDRDGRARGAGRAGCGARRRATSDRVALHVAPPPNPPTRTRPTAREGSSSARFGGHRLEIGDLVPGWSSCNRASEPGSPRPAPRWPAPIFPPATGHCSPGWKASWGYTMRIASPRT
jgi:hypothetical protein